MHFREDARFRKARLVIDDSGASSAGSSEGSKCEQQRPSQGTKKGQNTRLGARAANETRTKPGNGSTEKEAHHGAAHRALLLEQAHAALLLALDPSVLHENDRGSQLLLKPRDEDTLCTRGMRVRVPGRAECGISCSGGKGEETFEIGQERRGN